LRGTDREHTNVVVARVSIKRRHNSALDITYSACFHELNMIAIGDVVYLVILWSLTGPEVVSGQCTTVGCGALDGDDNKLVFSEVEELKLQLQQATAELGTFFNTNSIRPTSICRGSK